MKLGVLLVAACAAGAAYLSFANATVAFVQPPQSNAIIKASSDPVWVVDTDRIAIGHETIRVAGYRGPTLASTCAHERHLAKRAINYLRFEMALNDWSVRLEPVGNAEALQGQLYIGDRNALELLEQDVLTQAALQDLRNCEKVSGA